MKHFKIFQEHSIFEKQDIETVIKPNISYCITENHIHFIHRVKPIYLKLAVTDNQGNLIPSLQINILDNNDNVVNTIISDDEAIILENLSVNTTYHLEYVNNIDTYLVPNNITFTIDEHGEVTSTGTISEDGILLVEMQKTKVKISSVDVADGEELEGNHIQVLDSEGAVVEEWDSTTETHEIEGLKTGEEYTLRNTVASDGYILPDDTTFTIDEHGEVTSTGTISEEGILLVEMQKTKVKVSCVDVRDGAELEGGHIQVIDPNSNVVEEWDSTDVAHQIEGLKTGIEYTLRNTVASEGYILATDTTFTIGETGRVTGTTTTTTDEDGNKVLLVEMQITQVQISCTDIASSEELEGSTIQVIDSEGSVVEEWTSTTEAHEVYGLKTGEEYTLSITVAPDGYTLTTDTTFTIDETGNVTSTGTISEDGILLVEIQMTHVEISCTDVASGEELEGSTIQVIDSEGNVVEEWVSTTEAHAIEGLKIGEEYTLRTTVASDGFILPSDTTFTISDSGQVTSTGNTTTDEEGNTILLVELQKIIVKVSCVNIADGKELEGAHIRILNENGNIVDEWDSIIEPHTIEGLNVGNEYTLRNTIAPDGYYKTTDTTFTIDEQGQVDIENITTDEEGNTVLLIEFEITQVNLSLVNGSDGNILTNFTLQLIDNSENVIDEWVTSSNVHTIQGLLINQWYKFKCTLAPSGYSTDFTEDIGFSINEADRIIYTGSLDYSEGTLLIQYINHSSYYINITENLIYENSPLYANNFTTYIQVFLDEECTIPASDLYALQFINTNTYTTSVYLNTGNTTYYIKAVNSTGDPVEVGTINGITYVYNIDKDVINMPNDNKSTININIEFLDIPDDFYTE